MNLNLNQLLWSGGTVSMVPHPQAIGIYYFQASRPGLVSSSRPGLLSSSLIFLKGV